jgi:hypothetical protein
VLLGDLHDRERSCRVGQGDAVFGLGSAERWLIQTFRFMAFPGWTQWMEGP